jgi:class I lanthipeptide synthase
LAYQLRGIVSKSADNAPAGPPQPARRGVVHGNGWAAFGGPQAPRDDGSLLDGALRGRALDAADAFAAALRARRHAPDPSLASGSAGVALFLAHVAQISGRVADREASVDCLVHALETAAAGPKGTGLHEGFLGVSWTLGCLEGWLVELKGDDPNERVDSALLDLLAQEPWRGHYDLIRGLVGIGVYALGRLPRAAAVTCLERVVDHLEAAAERNTDGATWLTSSRLMAADARREFPRGRYDIGLAHGVPGVIALLGRTHAAGVAVDRAGSLLEEAVTWLLSGRLPARATTSFPYGRAPGLEPRPARSAWCYGDPGVAAALFGAARAVGERAWEQEAMTIARRAARRPAQETGVIDAGLCHEVRGQIT